MNNDVICRHCGCLRDDPNRPDMCPNARIMRFHAWATRDEVNNSLAAIVNRMGRRR